MQIQTDIIPQSSLFSSNHEVSVLRLDLVHPEVSGNKWFKLKYNLETAQLKGYSKILTFGGAYSNHILACASACHAEGLGSIGIIRGDELNANSNATLQRAQALGMELHFVSREDYRCKDDQDYCKALAQDFMAYIIPEGGSNYNGLMGTMDISKHFQLEYDHVFCAAGTGCTAAGVMISTPSNSRVHAISVLKGDFMQEAISKHISGLTMDADTTAEIMEPHTIEADYHFGGYGKFDDTLLDFISVFHETSGIKLDPIYTGKMAWAAHQFSLENQEKALKILLIHTGGLQGIEGFETRNKRSLFK